MECRGCAQSLRLVLVSVACQLSAALQTPAVPSIGRAIEAAATAEAVLQAAARIPPPGVFEKPHLAQDVHQVKRQTLAASALRRLSSLLVGSSAAGPRREALSDPRMSNLVLAAASPSTTRADGEDAALDRQTARAVAASLESVGSLCAMAAVDAVASNGGMPRNWHVAASEPLREPLGELAARADALSPSMEIADAVACRWSARRLFGRANQTPRLDALTAALPFDLRPALVALPSPGQPAATSWAPTVGRLVGQLTVPALSGSIPFAQSEVRLACSDIASPHASRAEHLRPSAATVPSHRESHTHPGQPGVAASPG